MRQRPVDFVASAAAHGSDPACAIGRPFAVTAEARSNGIGPFGAPSSAAATIIASRCSRLVVTRSRAALGLAEWRMATLRAVGLSAEARGEMWALAANSVGCAGRSICVEHVCCDHPAGFELCGRRLRALRGTLTAKANMTPMSPDAVRRHGA